jgi:hypothetical protein
VYIPSADPLERENLIKGAKLKVPISQLEERFRTVYSNAERNNLNITINSKNEKEIGEWEKNFGYSNSKTYNFHDIEGLKTSTLIDKSEIKPIFEDF